MKRLALALLLTFASLGALSQGVGISFGPGPGLGQQGAGGGDPLWASVTALFFNDNAANGSTTFTDQSTSATTTSVVANTPQYSNTTAPTGMTTSAEIGNASNGGNLKFNSGTSSFVFGTNDFTVEWFFYANTASYSTVFPMIDFRSTLTSQAAINLIVNGSQAISVRRGTTVLFSTANSVYSTATGWHYYALVRSSGTLTLYVDAVSVGSAADANNYSNDWPMTPDTQLSTTNFFCTATFWGPLRVTKAARTISGIPTLPFVNHS